MTRTLQDRHRAEIEHGAKIAPIAEAEWSWVTDAGMARVERRAALLSTRGELGPGKRVLELGCGIGIFSEPLARSGASLVALDISHALLERASERCRGLGITFVQASAESLPHPRGAFDAVVGSSVLHHLELAPALREARRVLRPGGRLAFAEPNMLNPQIFIERNIPPVRRWAHNTPDETAFFRWGLARSLRAEGFVDVTVEPYDFLHPSCPRTFIDAVSRIGRAFERMPVFREFAGSLVISGRAPV